MNGTPLQYCTAAQDRPTLSDRFWGAATSCLNVLILAHIVLFVTAVLRTVAESFLFGAPSQIVTFEGKGSTVVIQYN